MVAVRPFRPVVELPSKPQMSFHSSEGFTNGRGRKMMGVQESGCGEHSRFSMSRRSTRSSPAPPLLLQAEAPQQVSKSRVRVQPVKFRIHFEIDEIAVALGEGLFERGKCLVFVPKTFEDSRDVAG